MRSGGNTRMRANATCRNCSFCDIDNLKCRPQSKDAREEYDLTKADLDSLERCDFFKPKLDTNNKQVNK